MKNTLTLQMKRVRTSLRTELNTGSLSFGSRANVGAKACNNTQCLKSAPCGGTDSGPAAA